MLFATIELMLRNFSRKGFTLVELIIVIVVIGILASFFFVSYSGVARKASIEALRTSTRSVISSALAFEIENPGDYKIYFDDNQQINDDGYKLSISGNLPGDGTVSLNSNNTVSATIYNGTFCATKSGDSDTIDVIETNIENCSTYDVIQTCDSWATIAAAREISLSDLLDFNDETDSGSSTCGRNIKIPVEINTDTPASCFAFTPATGTITDYYYTTPGCPSDVKIPSSIGGVAVTAIGASAFEASNLTKLYIPSTITSIGNYAFKTNNLTGGLIWNANIDSISNTVFENSKPASLTFGSNVTKIPVNFLKGAAPTFTSLVIPSTITTVGAQAFEANSNIHSLTIPSSVTAIGDNAFKSVNLTGGLTWNANIDSVGTYTFENSRPAAVTFGSNVTKIPTNFLKNAALTFSTLNIPGTITSVGACAFEGDSNITSLTVPSSVTSVGNYAFKGASLSAGLTWNANIDSVGSETFRNTSISSVTWGSNVTKLPAYMFYYASGGFTTMTIPNTITMVGACSLEGKGLTSLTIGSSVATIGNYAFKANSLTSITIPSSVTSIGSWALESNNLTSITMGSGGTVISNWLLLTNDVFRTAYYASGAGTYTGTQSGTWTKL